MNKLLSLLIGALALATIMALYTSTPISASKLKLGWCYPEKHCTKADTAQEVFGDSDDTDVPLYYYYKNCVSFLAASEPHFFMNICQSENCVEACDAADTSGDCYSVPDNAPKGAAYGCLRRVKQRN